MKKAISVLLALLVIFSLFACSGQGSGSSASASPSTPAASPSPSAGAASSPSAPATSDVSANADKLGFFSDGVDPHSRKTYNLVFAYPYTLLLFQKMADAINQFSDKLNFNKLTTSTGESDMDLFIQNLETLNGQDVDGYIVIIDPSTKERIKEVLDEFGVPYIGLFNSVRDNNGSEIVPCIGLNQEEAGATTVQWLFDNYKTYWGDVDMSKIGLLNFTFSVSSDLNDRAIGAEAKYKELVKNENVYTVDGVVGDKSAQTGYNLASATFAGHPEIQYWFVASCLETYAQGAARAADTLSLNKNTLITDVGSDVLTTEWDTNYEGCWVSCLAISNYLYAAPTICGLIAMIDGKATPETLWSGLKLPTDKTAFYATANEMITKDTYKDYFNEYAQLAGAPLPYAD
ncbi:DNA-binding transcriptional regulator, LacI/PurR family [Sporobacter termitidis DSM 10068]|uniref:DNA-binding transcriptional regulator, LacI/PurR family n=1 Tax=Sporobacter termitidis DSM 10068 TaxID=1123282 RepID=A0A1M5Z7T3_9FIRM|nr:substrate-binding domain-containing protein [Sporobacter termitidis]SHI20295.1 DNA-binding transcriptional regulator, LacI/PurR family [Sporobacter termitidis DSM 10068]